MNKDFFVLKVVTYSMLLLVFATGCSLLKDLKYEVKENPLEMHGDKITANIDAEFIEKGLNKKAVAILTPTLVGENGVEKEFESVTFQGEKAAANGIVVPKGGYKHKYSSSIDYDPAFDNAKLVVKVKALKGGTEKFNTTTDPIAVGTIVTPLLIQDDDRVIMAEDKLVRSNKIEQKATINYLKGRYEVRANEKKKQSIKDFEQFLVDAKNDPKITLQKVNVVSYASPEGEIERNQNLASDRAGSAVNSYLNNALKKYTDDVNAINGMIVKNPQGEDWKGLKELIRASNHSDKNIIIRVAEMGNQEDRETELKKLAVTYNFLEKDIFPQLRRSEMVIVGEKEGYTDAELTSIAKSNPNKLTVEELMFTAKNLTDNLDEKLNLYNVAAGKDAKDWRSINNAGGILYLQGKLNEAKAKFEKAKSIQDNAIVNNNLGIIKRIEGERAKATELLTSATSAGKEVKYNIGLVNIQNGEYESAISNMGDEKTFNKALAQVLNKDYDMALSTLDNSAAKETAMGYYLKAIIGARKNSADMLINNLKSAIAKDSSLKDKAKNDMEFYKFLDNAAFKALF